MTSARAEIFRTSQSLVQTWKTGV